MMAAFVAATAYEGSVGHTGEEVNHKEGDVDEAVPSVADDQQQNKSCRAVTWGGANGTPNIW